MYFRRKAIASTEPDGVRQALIWVLVVNSYATHF